MNAMRSMRQDMGVKFVFLKFVTKDATFLKLVAVARGQHMASSLKFPPTIIAIHIELIRT